MKRHPYLAPSVVGADNLVTQRAQRHGNTVVQRGAAMRMTYEYDMPRQHTYTFFPRLDTSCHEQQHKQQQHKKKKWGKSRAHTRSRVHGQCFLFSLSLSLSPDVYVIEQSHVLFTLASSLDFFEQAIEAVRCDAKVLVGRLSEVALEILGEEPASCRATERERERERHMRTHIFQVNIAHFS